MIRLVFPVRRLPHLSLEDFQAYWRDKHGPLVASVAADLRVLRYVQTHRLDDDSHVATRAMRGGAMEPPHDGVAELWWESEKLMAEAFASKAGRAAGAALLADERTFIDLPSSPIWLAHEYPQVNPTPETIVAAPGSSIVRAFYPLRQQAHLDDAAARKYWLTEHGPIVRRGAHAAGLLCYRQVHRTETPFDGALRGARKTTVSPYLGHAEVWIDRTSASVVPERAATARATFVADERNFIEFTRSTYWLGKEHVIVDNR